MTDFTFPSPEPDGPTPTAPPPRVAFPPDDTPPPRRYDANLRLIRRRLADEQRTTRSRKWWKGNT